MAAEWMGHVEVAERVVHVGVGFVGEWMVRMPWLLMPARLIVMSVMVAAPEVESQHYVVILGTEMVAVMAAVVVLVMAWIIVAVNILFVVLVVVGAAVLSALVSVDFVKKSVHFEFLDVVVSVHFL